MITILPDHYPDRLRCTGTVTIIATAGGGCLRVTAGDLVVRFPIVAARVERAIVSGLERHAHGEVAIVERWLAERASER